MSFGLQGEMESITQRNFKAEDTGNTTYDLCQVWSMCFTHFLSHPAVKMEKKDTLTSATCLLHPHPASFITILCANIATLWLFQPLFIYLFIYFGRWRGGCNNVSHLYIYNWVVFGMAQSLEIFKYSCLEYLTSKDKQWKEVSKSVRGSRAVGCNCSFYAVTRTFFQTKLFSSWF